MNDIFTGTLYNGKYILEVKSVRISRLGLAMFLAVTHLGAILNHIIDLNYKNLKDTIINLDDFEICIIEIIILRLMSTELIEGDRFLLEYNDKIVDSLWFKHDVNNSYKDKTLYIPLGGLFHEV